MSTKQVLTRFIAEYIHCGLFNARYDSSIMNRPLTPKKEANAIAVWAFRNGYIEKLHVGKHSELLERPRLSRITDDEMRQLNIDFSSHIAEILNLRDNDPEEYRRRIDYFHQYCKSWEK